MTRKPATHESADGVNRGQIREMLRRTPAERLAMLEAAIASGRAPTPDQLALRILRETLRLKKRFN
jgi:hypothetical protein